MTIVTSTFSPRRAVRRSLHRRSGRGRRDERAPGGSCRPVGAGTASGARSRADELEVCLLEPSAGRPDLDDRGGRRLRTSRRGPRRASASGPRRRARSPRRRRAMTSRAERPSTERPRARGRPSGRSRRNRSRGRSPGGQLGGRPAGDDPAAARIADPVGQTFDVGQVVASSAGWPHPRRAVRDDRARPRPGPPGSMPAVGSSRIRTSGRPTSASASPSRCRSPPDSRRYRRRARRPGARRASSSSSGSRGSAWNAAYWRRVSRGSARGSMPPSWSISPTRARCAGPPAAGSSRAPGPTRVGAPVALDDLDGRGLAGAVRPEQRDELARARPSGRCRRPRSASRSA